MGAGASAETSRAARPHGPLLTDVSSWSVQDVCQNLEQRGMLNAITACRRHRIDGRKLLSMNDVALAAVLDEDSQADTRRMLTEELRDLRNLFAPEPLPAPELAFLLALREATGVASWEKKRGWAELESNQGCDCVGIEKYEGHVVALRLPQNSMQGALPAGAGALTRVRELRLERNTFPHTLPEDLGACGELRVLNLSGCSLGTAVLSALPAKLGALQQLHTLALAENNLRGELPDAICDCVALRKLDLSFNHLFGTFPARLGEALTNLTELRAFGNSFSGKLPASLGGLQKLVHLDLSDNSFKHTVPYAALSQCTLLRRLLLHSNYFKNTDTALRFLERKLPQCTELQLAPRMFTKPEAAIVETE
eukprot:g5227.t1